MLCAKGAPANPEGLLGVVTARPVDNKLPEFRSWHTIPLKKTVRSPTAVLDSPRPGMVPLAEIEFKGIRRPTEARWSKKVFSRPKNSRKTWTLRRPVVGDCRRLSK